MTITDTTTANEAEINGRIEVDPTTLMLGPNVRPEARLNKSFVASIRERGVLEPVVCYRDDDGTLIVLYGQRRTLGAIEARRASIPITIVPKPAEPDRLVDQVSENEHREALTAVERVGAYEQLAAVGLSAAQIAKRTATRRVEVDAGLATIVRREWLSTFAARKTAPAHVERFIATALLAGDHTIRQAMENNHRPLRELLGVTDESEAPSWMAGHSEITQLIEHVGTATPKRALVLTAALLLAAWEAKTGSHTWRNVSPDARRYLGQMVAWGYEPSEVEQLILTTTTDD